MEPLMDTEYTRMVPKYIAALSSTAHTYGNVLATAQRWVLRAIPIKFSSVHVNSRIAHSQILRTPQKYIKKEKPIIVFNGRVEYGEDTFMKGTLITQRRGGPFTTQTGGVVELNPILIDDESGLSLQYSQIRRVMQLDVVMTFDTAIEQYNVMDYLSLNLDWDIPFDMNTWLESYIAPEIMEAIGEISGVPVHDPNDNTITDFMNYMNGHSAFPITYKLAGETGKEEFYRYYHTNMLCTLTGLDKNTGENINHIMTNFSINFTLKIEFWSPGLLYLMSEKLRPEMAGQTIIPKNSTLIPVFADVFYLEDLNLAPGWQIYGHSSYILDKPRDTVDYSTLIQETIRQVIDFHIKNGIPLYNFLDIKVRQMGDLIVEGHDYIVDYQKNQITFMNEEWGFDTYTIIVTINNLYVNDLLKTVNKLD